MIKNNLIANILRPEVVFNISTRATQAFGGLVSIVLISRFLSVEDQGYYYAIQAFAASYVLFELGLSNTLINFFSNSKVSDDEAISKSRLSDGDMLAGAAYLYLCISLCMATILSVTGYFYLLSEARADLIGSWLLIISCIFVNLNCLPYLIYIEAKGGVIAINKMRLIQSLVSITALCLSLIYGLGVQSLGIYFTSVALVACLFFVVERNYRNLILNVHFLKETLHYLLKLILSTQIRVSLSWLFGYFTMAGLVPIILKIHGPEIAGRFGMTLQIVTLIMMVCFAFVSTRLAHWGALLSLAKHQEFETDFKLRKKYSVLSYITVSILFMIVIGVLRSNGFDFALRLEEPFFIILFLLNGFVTLIVMNDAAYIRIQKMELHHSQAIVYAVTLVLAILILKGEDYMLHIFIWLGCNIFLGFFLSKILIKKFRKKHGYSLTIPS
jgi:hypothetical protein